MSTLYQRIRERREALKLSQAELAERLGYSDRSTIAKIEKGVNDITQSKISAFAEALATTPAYLMGWTDDPIDYDDGDRLAEIPLSYVQACDGDVRQAYAMMKAVDEDYFREYTIPSAVSPNASSLSDEALRLALGYDKQLDTWGRIQVRTAMEQALTRRAEDARAIQEKDNCIQLPLAIQTMGKGIAIQLPDSDFETILVEGNGDTRRAIFAVRVCGNNSDWYDNDILLFEKDSYNGLNMFVIDGLSQIMTRADDKIYPIWVGKEVISLTADIKCRGHAFCFLRPEWVKGNKPIFPEGYQFKW